MVRRYAFTMIELIFAIVVIAVVVMSLPTMTQSVDQSSEDNIVQEAVFASQAILSEAISSYWDANSQFDAIISGGLSRTINTGNCNIGLNGQPNQRTGDVTRRCLSDLTVAVSNNAAIAYTIDNLAAQWNGNNIFTSTASKAAYKSNYTATAAVTQCSNGAGCGFGAVAINPDLKQLRITIRDGGVAVVVLRAFSANIGDISIAKRTF
ncbi:prepilin-type N-terminal cleavage/methylation domain-containing protein [Sulfurimonas sp.]|uniref:prepilin-type N-terminal cleavage/methylation domain-containing protein n=1 Tax=Sulfurimonas sp. TaxID=2022749 RepID=UPI003D0D2937